MEHTSTSSDGSPTTTFSMSDCIDRCIACYRACEQAAAHCLQKGGRHADAEHIRALLDCAEICRTSSVFMLRGSEHHHLTCGVCAEICAACATSCDALNDSEMKRCADACRACAASCASMAHHH